MFLGDPDPGSEAWPPHYLPQHRGFLLGLDSLIDPLSVCDLGELAAIQTLMAAARPFLHTHRILISNYNARGPIYTHLQKWAAAVETDTSSHTNQLQPSPGK